MKSFFILLGTLMILASSCSTGKENSLEIPSTALALEQESGKLAFAHSAAITERAVARYMVDDVRIFNDPSILPQSVNIENMALKTTRNGKPYLFFILKSGEKLLSVASELSNEGGYYTLAGDTHTCNGDLISNCSFMENDEGIITGCNTVNSQSTPCNHSITRTGGPSPVIGSNG